MIQFSWAKSREILFPFNFKRWFKILIIVWLAAVGVQAVGTNVKMPPLSKPSVQKMRIPKNFPVMLPQAMKMPVMPKVPTIPTLPGPETQALSEATEVSKALVPTPSSEEKTPALSKSFDPKRMAALKAKMERPKFKTNATVTLFLVATMAALGIGIFVLFLWISSRFNFVLLDAIVTREPMIKEPFKKHKEIGNSYFVWALVFAGISLGALLLAGLVLALSAGITKWNLAIGIPFVILGGFLALLALLAMIVVGIAMRDFVVPIMYREKISAMGAVKKFLGTDAFNLGRTFQYLLVIFGFWILAMILQSIVGVLAVIGGVIAGGIVAIPGILVIKALPFLKVPLIILGSFVGIALVLAVIVVIGMVMLPMVIFFRVFALAYLTRLYPECDLLEFSRKKV